MKGTEVMQEPDDLGYRCGGKPTLGANGRFFRIGGIYLNGLHWIFGDQHVGKVEGCSFS